MESLAYTIFVLYAARLPWSNLKEGGIGEILKSKQFWQKSRLLQGSCEYPLGDLVYYAQDLDFAAEPDYDYWREAFWKVDNASSDFPNSDPLYDPADTTEEVPRNMDFINWKAQGPTYTVYLPLERNTGRMEYAPGSDHDYRPASSAWGHPLTMKLEDTMDGRRDLIQDFVQHISQPPMTTSPSLAQSCDPEELRAFDAPIPFKMYIEETSEEESEGEAGEQSGGETAEETEMDEETGGGADSQGSIEESGVALKD